MRQFNSWVYLVLAGSAFLLGASSQALADKEVFVNLKCTKCHSVTAAGVEKKAADEEEAEEGEESDKVDPPDLSHVGAHHDAAFIKGYITKTLEHVPHDTQTSTKKHRVKFKGADADLEKLATWLATLK